MTFIYNPYYELLFPLISLSKDQKKEMLDKLLLENSVQKTYAKLSQMKMTGKMVNMVDYWIAIDFWFCLIFSTNIVNLLMNTSFFFAKMHSKWYQLKFAKLENKFFNKNNKLNKILWNITSFVWLFNYLWCSIQ